MFLHLSVRNGNGFSACIKSNMTSIRAGFCIRGSVFRSLHPQGSASKGVCIQGGLHPGESTSRGSAFRALHPDGSASGGSDYRGSSSKGSASGEKGLAREVGGGQTPLELGKRAVRFLLECVLVPIGILLCIVHTDPLQTGYSTGN